jgi:hypothetical protein
MRWDLKKLYAGWKDLKCCVKKRVRFTWSLECILYRFTFTKKSPLGSRQERRRHPERRHFGAPLGPSRDDDIFHTIGWIEIRTYSVSPDLRTAF